MTDIETQSKQNDKHTERQRNIMTDRQTQSNQNGRRTEIQTNTINGKRNNLQIHKH